MLLSAQCTSPTCLIRKQVDLQPVSAWRTRSGLLSKHTLLRWCKCTITCLFCLADGSNWRRWHSERIWCQAMLYLAHPRSDCRQRRWYRSMKKVLLQLMPNRVDLADATEIPGGHLPNAKKKKEKSLELSLTEAQRVKHKMHLNR